MTDHPTPSAPGARVKLTDYEIELLEIMDGRRPPGPWGAWITAALEGLHADGLAELESEEGRAAWRITPAGRTALSEAGHE